jgi:hypothetical protein
MGTNKARIDPFTLYSRAALIEMLEPLGIDPDAFVARIKPIKRFRMVWYGADLLNAIRIAPELPKPAGGSMDALAMSSEEE